MRVWQEQSVSCCVMYSYFAYQDTCNFLWTSKQTLLQTLYIRAFFMPKINWQNCQVEVHVAYDSSFQFSTFDICLETEVGRFHSNRKSRPQFKISLHIQFFQSKQGAQTIERNNTLASESINDARVKRATIQLHVSKITFLIQIKVLTPKKLYCPPVAVQFSL